MAIKLKYAHEDRQNEWADTIKEVIRDPKLIDKMGSADLKRISKALTLTIVRVGERAARAETALEQGGMVSDEGLREAFNSVTARNIELTGGRPPEWSYLYRDNVDVLHHFIEFEMKTTQKGVSVFGVLEDWEAKPLYDFDFADLGVSGANRSAHLMTTHLRQCFAPREGQNE